LADVSASYNPGHDSDKWMGRYPTAPPRPRESLLQAILILQAVLLAYKNAGNTDSMPKFYIAAPKHLRTSLDMVGKQGHAQKIRAPPKLVNEISRGCAFPS